LPFSDLPLSPALLAAIAELGHSEPFAVQTEAIPPILAGRDLVARAKTGSGKTLAFAAPILDRLGPLQSRRGSTIACLVLVPTRELAIQVAEVFADLARRAKRSFVVRAVHGGPSINPQMLALRGGADVLVATPGRLLDLASKNAVRLGSLEILVLDEADKMLDLGFSEELEAVLALLPKQRQTLLFSATLTGELETIAAAALHEPARIAVDLPGEAAVPGQKTTLPGATLPAPAVAASEAEAAAAPATGADARDLPKAGDIVELAYFVAQETKGPLLRRLITEARADGSLAAEGEAAGKGFDRVLVFASSTRRADNVARKLGNNGILAATFHGGLSQAARSASLADFRSGAIRVLVASDLASRGLDIEGLPCVVNYELPRSPLDYVHRIGRTGRAGASGVALTIVGPGEEAMFRLVEKRLGRRIARA
jgi:ATP-dependent RNA helicase RhlE